MGEVGRRAFLKGKKVILNNWLFQNEKVENKGQTKYLNRQRK